MAPMICSGRLQGPLFLPYPLRVPGVVESLHWYPSRDAFLRRLMMFRIR